MQQTAEFLFAIGSILLLGLATDFLGRRTFLPRVTLLLAFGIVVGAEVLAMIPETLSNRFDLIADMALLMIGFLLGGKLSFKSLKQEGRQLLWLSVSASLGTTVIVTLALVAASVPLEIAILLGCIAAATAPSAACHRGHRRCLGVVTIQPGAGPDLLVERYARHFRLPV